ncbi:DUF6078 family protein [uncultured Parabacteroides sp.]|uniref:DUF6078 family protein n=1 Tax=uncultured Parabacteroides sp. TaxID=512312 RepID=UPI00258578E0|nr:DUF6078 family protein [uncultured Parabacteroides sp.]
MKPESKYESVPHNFAYCLNNQCKNSAKCLRYLTSKQLSPERQVFSIVNPACTMPDEGNCPFFKADQKVRYAKGITHLLDELPHNKAIAIKRQIYAYLKKGTFYRIRNKERLISPDEQNEIRRIFLRHSIYTDPNYDEFVEQYDW